MRNMQMIFVADSSHHTDSYNIGAVNFSWAAGTSAVSLSYLKFMLHVFSPVFKQYRDLIFFALCKSYFNVEFSSLMYGDDEENVLLPRK